MKQTNANSFWRDFAESLKNESLTDGRIEEARRRIKAICSCSIHHDIPSEHDELYESIFLKLSKKQSILKILSVGNAQGWVGTVVSNAVTDWFRIRRVPTIPILDGEDFPYEAPDAEFERTECWDKALATLPETQAVVMKGQLEGKTNRELAVELSISAASVSTRAARAYRTLAECECLSLCC